MVYLPNPVRNLAGAGIGRIPEKWPDSGFAGAEIRLEIWADFGKQPDFVFAGAGAEIRCNPSVNSNPLLSLSV